VEDEKNREEMLIRQVALDWFEDRVTEQIGLIQRDFDQYRLSEAIMRLYNFIWNDFFSWLLEVVKPPYGNAIDQASYDRILNIYERLMVILHPFMPFITEEIYQQLRPRPEGDFVGLVSWPAQETKVESNVDHMATVQSLVTGIRDLRNKHQISLKENLTLFLANNASSRQLLSEAGMKEILIKMAALDQVGLMEDAPDDLHATLVQGRIKAFLLLPGVNVEEERKKLEEELQYARGFVKMIESKLSNERFVQNAPEAIVDKERKKLEDGKGRVAMLEESLKKLV